MYFGPKYDAALEMLVWEFISRLDELLPVPDFTQVHYHVLTSTWHQLHLFKSMNYVKRE